MDKIKLFVACHKPINVIADDVYTPIHVGRAISKFKDEMSDMIGDDTGDNISEKNPYYSELTAQYWVWKNVHDVEYVGFCHYSRFFSIPITMDNVDSLFKKYDVILLNYTLTDILENSLLHCVAEEDFIIFLTVLKKKYPEYEQTALDIMWGNEYYPRNMLVCKKELFDEYAEWLFDILQECEKFIRYSRYNRGKRVMGYLSEFFMPVYMIHNGYRLKCVRCVDNVGGYDRWKITNTIKRKIKQVLVGYILKILYKKPKSFEDYFKWHKPVFIGFKNDGIAL